MSRLENILAYKEQRDADIRRKEQQEQTEVEGLLKRVQALAPRIEELLQTATCCYENDISIEHFITEGIYHKLGFVRTWNRCDTSEEHKFKFMGYEMGGACGCFNFYTNGKDSFDMNERTGQVRLPKRCHLERLLKDFEDFEERFYQYVDEHVGVEPESYVLSRRKVLFVCGMCSDVMLIITDATVGAIEEWCRRYLEALEDGTYGKEVTLFDTLKKEYYVRLLHDSELENDSEDVEIIGYDEVYDLSDYMPSDEYCNSDETDSNGRNPKF